MINKDFLLGYGAGKNAGSGFSAADEGKVVSNGALVSQTSATYTENDTYDTTLINSVTVNVSGGVTPQYMPITISSNKNCSVEYHVINETTGLLEEKTTSTSAQTSLNIACKKLQGTSNYYAYDYLAICPSGANHVDSITTNATATILANTTGKSNNNYCLIRFDGTVWNGPAQSIVANPTLTINVVANS